MKNWIFRYFVFILGLYLITLGVVMIVRSSLGTSPISSLAYVMSLNSFLTLGMALFIVNVALIIGQFWFVRGSWGTRRDRIEILLQIPFSVLFGGFVDFNMWITQSLAPSGYLMALAFVAAGCAIQSVGVVLEVKPNVVAMSAEGFVKYATRRYNKDFGKFKVFFDITLVTLAIIASLLWSSTIDGVREGTIIAAISVGWLVSLNMRLLPRLPLSRFRRLLS